MFFENPIEDIKTLTAVTLSEAAILATITIYGRQIENIARGFKQQLVTHAAHAPANRPIVMCVRDGKTRELKQIVCK